MWNFCESLKTGKSELFDDSLAEHALWDKSIAEVVNSNYEVIVVSLEKWEIDLEISVADFHHVLQVLN